MPDDQKEKAGSATEPAEIQSIFGFNNSDAATEKQAESGNGWLDELGPLTQARCAKVLMEIAELDGEPEALLEAGAAAGLCEIADEAEWDKSAWALDQRQWMIDLLTADSENEELHIEAVKLMLWMPGINHISFERRINNATGKKLTLGDIKRIHKAVAEDRRAKQLGSRAEVEDTHDGIARHYLAAAPEEIVACGADLFVPDEQCVWRAKTSPIRHAISEGYSHLKVCKTNSHYDGIMRTLRSRTLDEEFFKDAPVGLATKDGFYTVEDGKLVKRELRREDRQTHRLTFEPVRGNFPNKLLSILWEGMEGSDEDKRDQLETLQQMGGTLLMGLMRQHRRGLLLKGPTSCGKSVLLNTIAALLPPDAVCHIAPQDLDDKELVQPLGKARLNIVPELQNTQGSIVSDKVKMLFECHPINARTLYIGSYKLIPTAGHMFSTNVWPKVDSPDSGFWERWGLVVFANTKPEDERDETLLAQILEEELPIFAGWLLDGVEKYLAAGGLHLSRAHRQGIDDWKRRRDSVAAFLADCDSIAMRQPRSQLPPIKRTDLFAKYQLWFPTSGYTFPVKSPDEFYDRVTQNGGMPGTRQGVSVFNGFADSPRTGNLTVVR